MVHGYANTVSVLGIMFLLTGCFGPTEPTSKEISDILKADNIKHGTQIAELISAEKVSCIAAKDKPGFSCDVKVIESRVDIRTLDPTKRIQPPRIWNLRFIKTDGGWEMAPQ